EREARGRTRPLRDLVFRRLLRGSRPPDTGNRAGRLCNLANLHVIEEAPGPSSIRLDGRCPRLYTGSYAGGAGGLALEGRRTLPGRGLPLVSDSRRGRGAATRRERT